MSTRRARLARSTSTLSSPLARGMQLGAAAGLTLLLSFFFGCARDVPVVPRTLREELTQPGPLTEPTSSWI
jgi:hypothetical protein